MSMNIDTMSTWSTPIPIKGGRPSHDTKDLLRTPADLTLGRIHGVQDYFYVNNGAYPKNGNYVCALIVDMLHRQSMLRSSWPHVLFLQLDNATGENKNHYVMALCYLLVQLGIFVEVCHIQAWSCRCHYYIWHTR